MPLSRHGAQAVTLAALAWTLSMAPVGAHADVAARIAAITALLSRLPDDASLYVQRADLLLDTGQSKEAIRDYTRALSLDGARGDALLGCGRARLAHGELADALRDLDRAVAALPTRAEARLYRGRALLRLSRLDEADGDFRAATSQVDNPDWVAEHAAAWRARGDTRRALAILNRALVRMPGAVSLELHALDCERRLGDTHSALARLDRLARRMPRPEPWLRLRAEILEGLGRIAEAHDAYGAALAALQTLPPHRLSTRSAAESEKALSEGMRRTSARRGR